MFDFSIVTQWIDCLLRQTLGLGDFWTILIECVLVGVMLLVGYALIAIVLIFMERKVCAYFQCRLGPMRVGPWGLLQVFADVLKMLIKEIFFVDFNVGIFLMTAISSIGVVGVFLAGWGSNNKYSVISAMRGAVQMISYEMSLCLCMITAVILTGTMQISGIVEAQTGPWQWLIFKGHIPALIGFLLFLIAGNAEANRGPFDLAEAESELTAGYHTEYSGMGFGYYYLAEYLNLFVISGIAATVFLGGWAPVNVGIAAFDGLMNYIPGIVWFMGKTFLVVWLLMWVRWTFPRLRIDQILALEWKYLMPLALINLVLMTIVVANGWHF